MIGLELSISEQSVSGSPGREDLLESPRVFSHQKFDSHRGKTEFLTCVHLGPGHNLGFLPFQV